MIPITSKIKARNTEGKCEECDCAKSPMQSHCTGPTKSMERNGNAMAYYQNAMARLSDQTGDGKVTQKDVGIAQGWLKKDEKTGEVVKTEESSPATKKKSKGSKDACYHKVKSRYKKWPSAYASGALAKCRKVGAANWGNKS